MSGGFNPQLKKLAVAISGGASFLASQKMMVKRGGITLDASLVTADVNGNKILKAGQFVTPVTATRKYGAYSSGAADGRQTPDPNVSGFLLESVNLRDGDVVTGVLLKGSVLGARTTPSPLVAAILTAIAGRIIVQ